MSKILKSFIYSLLLFILVGCSSRKVAVSKLKNEEIKNEEVINNKEEIKTDEEIKTTIQNLKTELLNLEIEETEHGTEIIVKEQGKETKIKTTARVRIGKVKNEENRKEEVINNKEEIKKEEVINNKEEIKTETLKTKTIDRNYRFAILWGGIVIFVAMLMKKKIF